MNDDRFADHDAVSLDSAEPQDGFARAWFAPLLAVGLPLLWALLIYTLIGERPRVWQYGVTPYVPGESFLSSQGPPRERKVPQQIVLPEPPPKGKKSAE